MNHHRFREASNVERETTGVLASSVSGFMACPVLLGPQGLQASLSLWQQVYQAALEAAEAAARPSKLERLQTACTN